jgi:hypothetical protein
MTEKEMKKEKGPLLLLNLNKPGNEANQDHQADGSPNFAPVVPEHMPPHEMREEMPGFDNLPKRPRALADYMRALLIVLSLVVAAGFILILLPQPTVDKMTQDLRSRRGGAQPEKIAFLYLGDEIKDNGFHVRGVVRNISSNPIDKMDAAVRFFAHDGTVLETTLVRLNKETIAPDEVAQFDLVYPNYNSEFGSYSVEFKMRDGDLVSYKDMRATRPKP